ncbi:MAG: ATP-binding cassette domain-containing protein [Defluviitaleaceae bacterium]|nr:ATP-binding cassette domain-containing protein [Defluviitaleaceae bacterium]
MMPVIELSGVTKIYSTGEKALDNVSLTIEQGDVFGIVGKSGAGKSTMLKLFGMLEQPTAGDLTILGESACGIKNSRANAIKKNIGTVFQGYNLLMQRSVAKNIAFPLELAGVDKKTIKGYFQHKRLIKKRCEELAQLVGLGDKTEAYPASLSGGQKQRVAIARALSTSPKILLCDEPTSALDSFTAKEILKLIKEINVKLGTTIVIITHDIHVVRAVCNKALVLEGGQIVEMGNVPQILENPKNPATRMLLDL